MKKYIVTKIFVDDIEPCCPSIFNDYEAVEKHLTKEIDEAKDMGSSDDDIDVRTNNDGEIEEVNIFLNDAFIIKLNVFAVTE